VLGLVSVVMWCPPISITAAVLGKKEMNAIERGESSPGGQTFAKVGFIMGIIFSIIHGLFYAFYGAFIVIWLIAMFAAAAST
jgi:hypothetical protein